MTPDITPPKALYAGLVIKDSSYCIAVYSEQKHIELCKTFEVSRDAVSSILSWFSNFEETHDAKFIAAGIDAAPQLWEKLFGRLWLELDIAPFQKYSKNEKEPDESAKKIAQDVRHMYNEDHSFSAKVEEPENRVITFPLVTLTDYETNTPPKEFQDLLAEAKQFKNKRINFFSATPQGGGVALMRHALIRLYRLLGVEADWYVMEDDLEIFAITKQKFHNVLQDIVPEDVTLNESEKKKFIDWSNKNAKLLEKVIAETDVFVIDDPQPSGLIPHIKKVKPNAPILYRSHIHLHAAETEKKGTSEKITWDFLWQFIKDADLFISHPIDEFIPSQVKKSHIVKMPATTDPLDGLNKELTDSQRAYYMRMFNYFLEQNGQTPLDPTRPFITQIARFDPSKGIPDLLESYQMLCNRLSQEGASQPELVIAGNGSIDDPDGVPIYNYVIKRISESDYMHLREDVKVMRLPHFDQLLNTLLRESIIVLQLSHSEGFEVKVSEALMKGKPVIVYNSGGIPLQVQDGINGYIVETGNTHEVTEKLYSLLTDRELYHGMSLAAPRGVARDVLTVKNATKWLKLGLQELEKKAHSKR